MAFRTNVNHREREKNEQSHYHFASTKRQMRIFFSLDRMNKAQFTKRKLLDCVNWMTNERCKQQQHTHTTDKTLHCAKWQNIRNLIDRLVEFHRYAIVSETIQKFTYFILVIIYYEMKKRTKRKTKLLFLNKSDSD